jgi:hypothetical protein
MPAPVNYAGNTLGTAKELNITPSIQTFTDWAGSLESNDYNRLSLGGRSSFNPTLDEMTANADMEEFGSSRLGIGRGIAGSTSTEYFGSSWNGGTYYTQGVPYETANTNRLNAATTPADNAGNTLSTARVVNLASTPQTFQDWVGTQDTNDYYRFSVGSPSGFNLTLNGMSANADVHLLNSAGAVISRGTVSGNTGTETITSGLDAGTYYIRVFPVGAANTNYNLSASITPVDYAGNTTIDARNININSNPSTYTDWVGSIDLSDYYSFNISNTSDFQLVLNGLTADADVQLLRLNNNGTTTQVGSSAASGTSAEVININNLAAGTYMAWVYQYSGDTFYNLSLSASLPNTNGNITSDWFSQNLKDSGIRTLTQSLANDGELSRNDMIAIFRNAKDGSVVDANELLDLRAIVNNANLLGMPDYVRVLSYKIAYSDVANQRYQGKALGNLSAGSTAAHLENLIGKWFLGSDRPVARSADGKTTYTYRQASGSLFQDGISFQDVKQGDVGNCYFLAGLAEAALHSPSTIESMFIDNGDNTYTVGFFKNGVLDFVTVDKFLPTDASQRFVYASTGNLFNSASNELWVALAEKAYAQLNESGWIGQDNTNSYQGIEGGWDGYALNHITGVNTGYYNFFDFNSMVGYFQSGNWMSVSSKVTGVASSIVPNHSYLVVDYNAATKQFTLFNPWGVDGAKDEKGVFKPGTLKVNYSQLIANFDGWTWAAI